MREVINLLDTQFDNKRVKVYYVIATGFVGISSWYVNVEQVNAYHKTENYRVSVKKYKKSGKGKIRIKLYRQGDKYKEYGKMYEYKYPERRKALSAVSHGIRDGKLFKKPCMICGTVINVQAHHQDYNKLLNVQWLCSKHHCALHKAKEGDVIV